MLTSEMSSENIKNIDNDITGLLAIGNKVANVIKEDNISIICSKSPDYDLIMEIRQATNANPLFPQNINPGTYYFNITNLPQYLRSPEIIEVVTKKCCERSNETKSGWDLKSKYKRYPYLVDKESSIGFVEQLVLKLTDELMEVYYKFINEKQLGHKYALIGPTDRFESQEQRIENFINSGRADRVCSEGAIGPGTEHTVSLILKDNKKSIRTAHVMNGSFPLNRSSQKIPINERWSRMIID
jgi:hypothetical protein